MMTFQPTYFAVQISIRPDALIEVRGELDLGSVPTFNTAVRDLDLSGCGRVVLDLRRLTFIDAAGLRAVLHLHEQCLNVATALTIFPGPRSVQRVFELTGADRFVPFRGPGTPGTNRPSGLGGDRHRGPDAFDTRFRRGPHTSNERSGIDAWR